MYRAYLQVSRGSRDEAKVWYVHALTVYEQALGKHHPKQRRHAHALLLYSAQWDSMRE